MAGLIVSQRLMAGERDSESWSGLLGSVTRLRLSPVTVKAILLCLRAFAFLQSLGQFIQLVGIFDKHVDITFTQVNAG